MAEALTRNMLWNRRVKGVEVHSAGTSAVDGIGVNSKVIQVCKEHGVDVTSHLSRSVKEEFVKSSDYVLVMEKAHFETLADRFPGAVAKIKMLSSYSENYQGEDIADPTGGSTFQTRTALAILNECVKGLLDDIL